MFIQQFSCCIRFRRTLLFAVAYVVLAMQCRPTLSLLENSVLLSSRPYSWSRVVSRPNLPALVLVLVLLLNKTMTLLISTVRSQPQSCDYILYITETHCPCFDMHARFSRLHAVMELYLYFALNCGCTDIVDPEL